ncbi:MAG: AI-2E family transporter [Candidatus Eisenbacteria bacterium]|nr:AI-2E family transporter [Candidatus Eisenbacteria bacterium]
MADVGGGRQWLPSRAALPALMVVGAVLVLHVLRPLAQTLFVVFGGILFAVFLDGVTSWLVRHTRLPRPLLLTLVIIAVLSLPVLAGSLIGPSMAEQVVELGEQLPESVESLRSGLSRSEWGRSLLESYPEFRESLELSPETLSRVTGVFSTTAGVVAGFFVIIFIGIYMAASPGKYVSGLVQLFPVERRERAREIVVALVNVLRRWLAGRVGSMTAVGVLTLVGLAIAGVPFALALSAIAALLTFVPYVGPVLAAVPAILVALVDDPVKALFVVVLYIVVQILENYIITPLIQQRAVSLGPALLITVQIILGVLFGPVGVLFATPLAVVAAVAVQAFYVEDVLGDRTDLLGGRR